MYDDCALFNNSTSNGHYYYMVKKVWALSITVEIMNIFKSLHVHAILKA